VRPLLDSEGNLWIEPIPVIALHGTTAVLWIGEGHEAVADGVAGFQPAGTGGEFSGGSGRNWKVTSGPSGVRRGFYRPSVPDTWASVLDADWTWTRDPGDGSFSLHDGTDILASTAAVASLSGVASAGTFPALGFALESVVGSIKTYRGSATILLIHDTASGNASIVEDGSFTQIALRAAIDYTSPAGSFAADASAEVTYNGGAAWDYVVTGGASPTSAASTAYGETNYGGAPFTVDVEFEGGVEFPTEPGLIRLAGSSAQDGVYLPTGWQSWVSESDPLWTATVDGTGAGELSDGADIVATRAADAARLYDLGGTWTATTYGRTTYGTPEDTTAGTRSAGTFTEQDWTLAGTAGGIETWIGVTDPSLFVELDTATGDALLKDGTDTVGERLGGSTATPDGVYDATVYGAETYGSGGSWTYTLATSSAGASFEGDAGHARALPVAGVWWAELTLDGSFNVTAAAGPFFGPALPANAAGLAVIPIAESDGTGTVRPILAGSFTWFVPAAWPA
jgi:hypothetical protein